MADLEPTAVSSSSSNKDNLSKSALQENLDQKGKNAYYFAHAHKATGPKWDGKKQPRLLKRESSNLESKKHAFDYSKSSIQKYAFLDQEKSVKLYIDLEQVGEKCTDEDIQLDYTETSMCLVVNNYKENNEPLCLSFGKLSGSIEKATCTKKTNRLVVTLTKMKEGEWHTINDKGTPSPTSVMGGGGGEEEDDTPDFASMGGMGGAGGMDMEALMKQMGGMDGDGGMGDLGVDAGDNDDDNLPDLSKAS